MQELTNQAHSNEQLKLDILEMMNLVVGQLEKSHLGFINHDIDLCNEIISLEKKVNGIDVAVHKACENILALYSPVASDLRFVLAVKGISSQLERIGDHAEGIAEYIINDDLEGGFDSKFLDSIQFGEMFEIAISMVNDAIYGFTKEDTESTKWVFGKDKTLDRINQRAPDIISELSKENPDSIKKNLYLFSIMKKLERVGDLAKNIAEETVFCLDAKFIKHRRARKYKESK